MPKEYTQIQLWIPHTQSLFFIGSKLIISTALLLKKWDPETSKNKMFLIVDKPHKYYDLIQISKIVACLQNCTSIQI